MTGISTSVGLISGIDTGSLIEQLLAVESRPKVLALNRQAQLQAEQSAFLGLNSLLLALQSASAKFGKDKTFDLKSATSSNESVLKGTATASAQAGTYTFLVDQLVSTNQYLSAGFADRDATPLNMTDLSFEYGKGRLETDTALAGLNNGNGVSRGKIKITDSSGAVSTIDLSRVVTMQDVLDAINADETVNVTAKISSDGTGLTVTDNAGGGGSLKIEDATGYTTATSLGIAGTAVGEIVGTQINSIGLNTRLATLNDGNGVLINSGIDLTDFNIQTADGTIYEIKLGKITSGEDTLEAVTTLQGVKDRIESQTSGAVTLDISADGLSIELTDSTTGGSTFQVLAGTAGATQGAIDLGIFKSADPGTPTVIGGDQIKAGLNSVLTRSLNGGSGLGGGTTLEITDRAGNFDTITLDPNSSMSDIIDAINASATLNVTASLNSAGNGLLLTDTVGGGSNFIVGGDAAAALGIETDPAGVASDTVRGTNLQLQYVAGSTLLTNMNYGRGIGKGSFRITDGEGEDAVIDIGSDSKTLQDIIAEINSKGLAINARVNDTGDGLLIESTSDNPFAPIKVESVTGSTAKDLNILGSAEDVTDNNFINGSYEQTLELEATDTLDDLITKLNNAGFNVSASLINNGTGEKPYYLSLTSKISGTAGDLIIDTGGVDLGLTELNEAQDAVVFFGSTDPARAVLVTSTTNTLDNVVTGVKIDLKSPSETPVTLTITEDTTKQIETVKSWITSFNAVITRINDLGSYDSETEERGVLLGNSTIASIEAQLYRTVQGSALGVDTSYQNLAQIGINVGTGGKLVLNEETLREALTSDPDAVANVFAARKLADDQSIDLGNGISYESSEPIFESLGVVERLNELVKDMTDSIDGTMTVVRKNYDTLIEIQKKRIEAFDVRLEARREQLTRQFAAMETALASLQQQQSALGAIRPVA
ncbi:MAG: flagellar filament capping protein FliD [Phycisphaerales bacterium]|nr:flagellar filament capping protein FliD [Phycisphaerales bacterium]